MSLDEPPPEFVEWLAGRLDELEVDGSAYGAYAAGIIADGSAGTLEERVDMAFEMVEGASEGGSVPESLKS